MRKLPARDKRGRFKKRVRLKALDPLIYSGVDRAERRRVARELERLEKVHVRIQTMPLPHVGGFLVGPREFSPRLHPPPLRLLACGKCHRTIPLCTCTDADGKPLDWALVTAL